MSSADVLYCTDAFHEQHATRLTEVAPDLEIVELGPSDTVDPADIARITFAFLSSDTWPGRAKPYLKVLMEAPNLRWFHTFSSGVDHPIFDALVERGVRLSSSTGANAPAVAERALMFTLALAQQLPSMNTAQREHRWEWRRWTELSGLRIAVAGYGPVGQRTCELLEAFGCDVVALRRTIHGDEAHTIERLDDLVNVGSRSDVLIAALPANSDTEGLFSQEFFSSAKPGMLFVNVARGELVDQEALIEGLDSGAIGGAALDVAKPEPLPSDNPFWDVPNVIITPHNAGSGDRSPARVLDIYFENLRRISSGEDLLHEKLG